MAASVANPTTTPELFEEGWENALSQEARGPVSPGKSQ